MVDTALAQQAVVNLMYCQVCGHMGALLFVLAKIISSGEAALPSDATVTDVPCEWSKPKGAAVDPKPFSDIQVRKEEQTTIRRTAQDYGQRYMGSRPPPTPADMTKLRQDLLSAACKIGKEIPAVHALHPSQFSALSEPQNMSCTLNDTASEMDYSILPSSYLEVSSSAGPPIASLLHLRNSVQNMHNHDIRELLTSNLTLKDNVCALIEETTRGQSANLAWYEQRRGSITSTSPHGIMKVMKGESRADIGRLVKDCLGERYLHLTKPPRPNKLSLKWGIVNEVRARQNYKQLQSSLDHSGLRVDVPGLVVSQEAAYLRASPDGIVHFDCHPSKLLEIKCPYGAKELSVCDAIRQKKIKYIVEDNGSYTLLNTSDGYFTQVQMTMALLGLETCDFLIWTPRSFLVVPVAFDQAYWDSVKHLLKCFFRDHILPAINSTHPVVVPDIDTSSDEDCIAAMMSLEAQVDTDSEGCNSLLTVPIDSEVAARSVRMTVDQTTQPISSTPNKTSPNTSPDQPSLAPPQAPITLYQPMCSTPCRPHPNPLAVQVLPRAPLKLQQPTSTLCKPQRNSGKSKQAKENRQPLQKKKKRSSFLQAADVSRCSNKNCQKILSEADFVAEDNSNASVQ